MNVYVAILICVMNFHIFNVPGRYLLYVDISS